MILQTKPGGGRMTCHAYHAQIPSAIQEDEHEENEESVVEDEEPAEISRDF
jgi:hypothetical protein